MGGRLSKSANKPAITQRGARTARWAVRRAAVLLYRPCAVAPWIHLWRQGQSRLPRGASRAPWLNVRGMRGRPGRPIRQGTRRRPAGRSVATSSGQGFRPTRIAGRTIAKRSGFFSRIVMRSLIKRPNFTAWPATAVVARPATGPIDGAINSSAQASVPLSMRTERPLEPLLLNEKFEPQHLLNHLASPHQLVAAFASAACPSQGAQGLLQVLNRWHWPKIKRDLPAFLHHDLNSSWVLAGAAALCRSLPRSDP
jgi:hypothetical protein